MITLKQNEAYAFYEIIIEMTPKSLDWFYTLDRGINRDMLEDY
jgi:hypothetical protein